METAEDGFVPGQSCWRMEGYDGRMFTRPQLYKALRLPLFPPPISLSRLLAFLRPCFPCFLVLSSFPLGLPDRPQSLYHLSVFFPMAAPHVPLKIRIKVVIPSIPIDKQEKALLIEDLDRMGCAGLVRYLGVYGMSEWCANSRKAHLTSSKEVSAPAWTNGQRRSGGRCTDFRPTVTGFVAGNTNT